MAERKKYAIGLDFGTLAAKAVLVDIAEKREVAVSTVAYQDEVIDSTLPYGEERLPGDYALQNPSDYIDALYGLLTEVWRKGRIRPEQVIGIGVAFASCTLIPLDDKNRPLCMDSNFSTNPHSWPKCRKHHAAQAQAERISRVAKERKEDFLQYCGDKVSSEWMIPKILEILDQAPEIYQATKTFIEAGDWIVYLLTGRIIRSTSMASLKAFWSEEKGYPDQDFFTALDPRLADIESKLQGTLGLPGTWAGGLLKKVANEVGLPEGIGVSAAVVSDYAALPAVGLRDPGTTLMIMGTSICHITVSDRKRSMSGTSGVTMGNFMEHRYTYETGQAAVGDIYNWFIYSGVMYYYANEMHDRNVNVFRVLDEKMAKIRPGSSGLLALDWWNGERAELLNGGLSGLIVGLTLGTKLEEIYRAIVESTAYGARRSLENIAQKGVAVGEIYACGNLAKNSKEVMQIFADVLGKPIHVTRLAVSCAYGAAMYGAMAAGRAAAGWNTVAEMMDHMVRRDYIIYEPDPAYRGIYDELYTQYCSLYDFFGREQNTMQKLREMKEKAHHIDRDRRERRAK